MITNIDGELREITGDELSAVEGGSLPKISIMNLRDLMAERGDAPGQQETLIVSLPPSRKP